MSYLWVYESNNLPINITPTPIKTPIKYTSFIDYSYEMKVTNNYIVTKFKSFDEVHQYIKDQISIFENTFNNQKNTNLSGKTMNQRYQDIIFMQISFNNIMDNVLKSYYGKDYNKVAELINKYYNSNEIINNGLDELNGNSTSIVFSQNILLDSTIFSTVLWTILAICLLYYVFIKL